MGKSKNKVEEITLAEGIKIESQYARQIESRFITLILKGCIVWMIVFGVLGGVLSAFDINYSVVVFAIVLFLASMYCVLLYYNIIWENLGYVLLLIFMAAVGMWLRTYINSGFNGFMNRFSQVASSYLELKIEKTYGNVNMQQSLSFTIAASYIGCVSILITNILVSRKMRYISVGIIGMGFLSLPLYLEKEPALVYWICFFAGMLVMVMLKRSGHFALCRNNNAYQYNRRSKKLTYRYAGKIVAKIIVMVILFCTASVVILYLLLPKSMYKEFVKNNALKEYTKTDVAAVYTQGLWALFNEYNAQGGLSSGRLGGISSLTFDYETDFKMIYVPYTYQRVYLKSFQSVEYVYLGNHWEGLKIPVASGKITEKELENYQDVEEVKEAFSEISEDSLKIVEDSMNKDTYSGLKKNYENGNPKAAWGKMKLQNETLTSGNFKTYYSKDGQNLELGKNAEIEFYPMVKSEEQVEVSPLRSDVWTKIPDENRECIAKLCDKLHLTRDMKQDEVIAKIQKYFQEEIPYTYRPGKTPRGEDFVNYFLEKQKKGFCAHFASASTLMLRYLGIPARYVEGYAIDSTEVAEDAEILDSIDTKEYYSGANLLGESKVVSYDVSDGNAHAWVEVYEEGKGWIPMEFTPTSDGEENDSIFAMFRKLFQSDRTRKNASGQTMDDTDFSADTFAFILRWIGVLAVSILLLIGLLIYMINNHRKRKLSRNDKLMLSFQKYLGKCTKEYEHQWSIEEALEWLKINMEWTEQMCKDAGKILNQAAYSKKEITEAEEELLVKNYFQRRKKCGRL
ncbi:MAG: transglutaminase domain-containing protein [Lachnospiraceae bacterium]|nr:transglutaminase domain-containing protein [Lachnospiraceae bacterium]